MNKSKILIIDDDDFVRGTYVTIFDQAGFEVVEARDGQEALEKIEKEIPLPNIIFTGILMPRLGGLELLGQLKNIDCFKNIPVVVISHRGQEEDRKKALSLGARDFIVSGFISPAEVVERVNKILAKKKTYILMIDKNSPDFEKFKNDHPNLFVDNQIPMIHLESHGDGGFSVKVK